MVQQSFLISYVSCEYSLVHLADVAFTFVLFTISTTQLYKSRGAHLNIPDRLTLGLPVQKRKQHPGSGEESQVKNQVIPFRNPLLIPNTPFWFSDNPPVHL